MATITNSIPAEVQQRWQNVVDVLAEVVQVPAGLIMRIDGPDIEVLRSSRTEGNPYTPGDRETLAESGLYCETVIRSRRKLLVPDAAADTAWRHNPDMKFGLVSYLGFPVFLPSGEVFGTLCVLDSKANAYTPTVERFMVELKGVIESQLALLEANRQLEASVAEIRALRGILPICMYCKSIRDDEGFWQRVEAYLDEHTAAELSHGICPTCMEERYPEVDREPPGKGGAGPTTDSGDPGS